MYLENAIIYAILCQSVVMLVNSVGVFSYGLLTSYHFSSYTTSDNVTTKCQLVCINLVIDNDEVLKYSQMYTICATLHNIYIHY